MSTRVDIGAPAPTGGRTSTRPAAAMELPDLDTLPVLGRGAATTVYRLRYRGTDYALKVFNHVADGESDTGRALVGFRREAAIMASIDHPGLPRIYEVGQAGNRPYLVMELLEGQSLGDVLARGPLAPEHAVRVALDLAEALIPVHHRGLVHRDVKPQNVVVGGDGGARLIDFGLATRERRGDAVTAGTLAYSAPEQSGMLKRPVDARSDLYSLGVVLFECLTGVPPFPTDDVSELVRMHAVTPPPDPGSMVTGVPRTLSAIVATLLAKDPDDRYQSGTSLAADLRRAAADPDTQFPPGRCEQVGTPPPADRLSGRSRELTALAARWAQARDGRGGACVIRGPGGSGKSRLAAEIMAIARKQGALVLSGKSSTDTAMPLAPLRSALDEAVHQIAGLPEAERERWQSMVRSAAGVAAPLVGTVAPALGVLLGTGDHREDGERSEQVTVAVVEFLAGWARAAGGLLLHLDDVQWADEGTRRIVGRLTGVLRETPLLVLCTARDDSESLPATDAFCAVLGDVLDLDLGLDPLSEEAVTDLLAAQLPGMDAGSTLPRLLTVRSNGNPFIAREYLHAIIDAGLLRPSWHGWELDEEGLAALELPRDALGLVLARVDALGAGTRRMLSTAAAFGARFHPELISRACGDELCDGRSAIREATGRHLIEPCEGGMYAFVHDRIREALVEDLDERQRAMLHRRIADTLAADSPTAPELIYAMAHHYLLAEPTGASTQIFAACRAAGQLALADHAAATAATFLEGAVRTGLPLDAAFLLMLGTALHRTGRHAQARSRLAQALAATSTPTERARILLELAGVYQTSWDTTAASDAVRRGLAELGAPLHRNPLVAGVSSIRWFLLGVLVLVTRIGFGTARGERAARYELILALHVVGGYACMDNPRPGRLIVHSLSPFYALNRLGRGRRYAEELAAIGYMAGLFRLWPVANACLRRAQASARDLGDPELIGLPACFRGAARYMGGKDDGAAWMRAMEDHGRWLGPGLRDDSCAIIAWDAVVAGRTQQAISWYERGIRNKTQTRDDLSTLVTISAVISSMRGRAVEAGTELRRLRPILTEHRSKVLYMNLLLGELHACIEQDDLGEPFERAVREFLALRVPRHLILRAHRPFWLYHAFGRLAQCQLPADDTDRARRRAAAGRAVRQLARAANTPFLRYGARLARAQLCLVDNRPQRCLRLLSGLPVLKPDAPLYAYEVARTRARALQLLGHAAEALRQATLAHTIALSAGWPHRARWIQAEFDVAAPGLPKSRAYTSMAGDSLERQRLQALSAVRKAAARIVDPDALARIALDETIRILAADRAFLFLTTADDQLVPHLGRDAAGNDLAELSDYATTLVHRVAVTGEPIVVTGTEEGAALGARSAVIHGLRSILVAALRVDNRVLGVVYLDSQVAKGIFTADDADLLTAMTDHIATSLETARAAQLEVSAQRARQQRDLAEMLRDALTEMSASLDPDDVLDRLLARAASVAPGQDACLLTHANPGVSMRLRSRNTPGAQALHLPDDRGVSQLLAVGRPRHGTHGDLPDALATRLGPVGSWLVLPLATPRTALGALVLAAPAADAYPDALTNLVAALVAQGMTAYDNATLFAQVQALAVVDDLTGVPNRRRLFEVAERDLDIARRHRRPAAAMMVDIDHFKRINDRHGHPTGDDVIRTVAARLTSALRANDVMGRYGGEEFAIFLSDIDVDTAEKLADRLRRAVSDCPVDTRSGPTPVTVSVGVTALVPGDHTVAALLERADKALYQAKQEGRDRVCVTR